MSNPPRQATLENPLISLTAEIHADMTTTETLVQKTESSKQWADGPFKLISSAASGDTKENPVKGARRMAVEMSIVHNWIIRGINSVYVQCENVAARGTAKDKADFANYAKAWSDLIEEHHHTEETLFFPEVNALAGVPGLMDGNVDEHKLFHDGLGTYREYVDKIRNRGEELDGAKLRGIIDSFMPAVQDHLHHEIGTLVGLEKYSEKADWADWFSKKVQQIIGNSMKDSVYRADVFPLSFVLHDGTYEDSIWAAYPPIPWLMQVLLRFMFMGKRKDWWRFAPCGFYSNPRELPFA
ncbi:hypothetical protein HJFPF1_03241 [Paramyrothecium foliicola]|nr:hypothetical protein HJFPF1_03241 [Paramyrothecium foliicola]